MHLDPGHGLQDLVAIVGDGGYSCHWERRRWMRLSFYYETENHATLPIADGVRCWISHWDARCQSILIENGGTLNLWPYSPAICAKP